MRRTHPAVPRRRQRDRPGRGTDSAMSGRARAVSRATRRATCRMRDDDNRRDRAGPQPRHRVVRQANGTRRMNRVAPVCRCPPRHRRGTTKWASARRMRTPIVSTTPRTPAPRSGRPNSPMPRSMPANRSIPPHSESRIVTTAMFACSSHDSSIGAGGRRDCRHSPTDDAKGSIADVSNITGKPDPFGPWSVKASGTTQAMPWKRDPRAPHVQCGVSRPGGRMALQRDRENRRRRGPSAVRGPSTPSPVPHGSAPRIDLPPAECPRRNRKRRWYPSMTMRTLVLSAVILPMTPESTRPSPRRGPTTAPCKPPQTPSAPRCSASPGAHPNSGECNQVRNRVQGGVTD